MFVDNHDFPVWLGRNFVGSMFRIIFIYQTNAFIYVLGNVNSWVIAKCQSHEHWSSTNNGDSTVYLCLFSPGFFVRLYLQTVLPRNEFDQTLLEKRKIF